MGDSYFRRHYPEDERMSDGELFKKYSGLLPEFGRVVCVSAGFITGEERKIQSFIKGGEEDILKETVNLLNRVHKLSFSLCGHNIKTFDLPYLGKRMLINKIKPSVFKVIISNRIIKTNIQIYMRWIIYKNITGQKI